MLTLEQPAADPVNIDRLPPHSLQAEQGVLGCIMLAADEVLPICIEKIKDSEDFYDLRHRTVYDVMLSIYDDRRPIDTITLQQALKDRNELESVGGAGFLSALPDDVPSAANIDYYIGILVEKARLRRVVALCTDVVSQIFDNPDTDNILSKFEQGAIQITSESVREYKQFKIKESVIGAINSIEALHQRQGTLSGLSTGFIDFDKMTNGLHGGEMIVIAARPSVGKTSLAMNIAESVAINQSEPVGVFSLEMTSDSLVMRMLCSLARVNLRSIQDGFLSERDFPKLTGAAGRLSKAGIHIDDTPGLSLSQLRAKARRLHHLYGIKLFVIDYLQLLHLSERVDSRQREVGAISNGIKALAKELNVPIVVLSQLNRDMEKGGKGGRQRKPRLSDLRESGDIEQDADLVGLLYKSKEKDDDDSDGAHEAVAVDLDIAKQRNGPTGLVHLTFLKAYTRFESAAKISAADLL